VREAGLSIGGGGRARALAHLLDRRPWPGRLDALADDLIEGDDLGGRQPVGWVVLAGQAVLAAGGVELILGFELAGPVEVRARGGQHGALECNLVVGVVPVRARCRPVVLDRLVEVPFLHRLVALAEGLARGAARREQEHCRHPCPSGEPGKRLLRCMHGHDPFSRMV
jgi:hypothetical protein